MYIYIHIHLLVCTYKYIYIYIYTHYLSIHLSRVLSIHPCIYPEKPSMYRYVSICLSVHLSISIDLSIVPSIHLSIVESIYPSFLPSIHLCITYMSGVYTCLKCTNTGSQKTWTLRLSTLRCWS